MAESPVEMEFVELDDSLGAGVGVGGGGEWRKKRGGMKQDERRKEVTHKLQELESSTLGHCSQ